MARLFLSLLGSFQVELDGQPVTGFECMKTRALLAYLADQPGKRMSRSSLAGLLWPDRCESAALGNLRHALANLRSTIHDVQISPPYLVIEREAIALDLQSDISIDTYEFCRLVDLASCWNKPTSLYGNLLQLAVSLYRSDFLEGFQLADTPDFEEWILARRVRYREQYLDVLYELAETSLTDGAYDQAKRYAQYQIALESYREEAHCQLMRALALGGHRCKALAQYTKLKVVLKKELDVDPSREAQQLYEYIRDNHSLSEINSLI